MSIFRPDSWLQCLFCRVMAKKCQITKEPANQAVYDYASDVLLVTYQLFNCRSSSVNLAIFCITQQRKSPELRTASET